MLASNLELSSSVPCVGLLLVLSKPRLTQLCADHASDRVAMLQHASRSNVLEGGKPLKDVVETMEQEKKEAFLGHLKDF